MIIEGENGEDLLLISKATIIGDTPTFHFHIFPTYVFSTWPALGGVDPQNNGAASSESSKTWWIRLQKGKHKCKYPCISMLICHVCLDILYLYIVFLVCISVYYIYIYMHIWVCFLNLISWICMYIYIYILDFVSYQVEFPSLWSFQPPFCRSKTMTMTTLPKSVEGQQKKRWEMIVGRPTFPRNSWRLRT